MTDEVTPGDEESAGDRGIGRRNVLYGAGIAGAAGVAVLAGCGGSGGGDEKSATDLKGKEIAKVADVPVGGGKVNPDDKVVVTQPAQGSFKAFTAVCTHKGCTVGSVADGLIKCPCHGSEFKIADGTVRRGPAEKALTEFPVQVKGGGIVVT